MTEKQICILCHIQKIVSYQKKQMYQKNIENPFTASGDSNFLSWNLFSNLDHKPKINTYLGHRKKQRGHRVTSEISAESKINYYSKLIQLR